MFINESAKSFGVHSVKVKEGKEEEGERRSRMKEAKKESTLQAVKGAEIDK